MTAKRWFSDAGISQLFSPGNILGNASQLSARVNAYVTSMAVLIFGRKFTLATSHAAPGESRWVCQRDRQTDGQTGGPPDRYITLSAGCGHRNKCDDQSLMADTRCGLSAHKMSASARYRRRYQVSDRQSAYLQHLKSCFSWLRMPAAEKTLWGVSLLAYRAKSQRSVPTASVPRRSWLRSPAF